MPPILAAVWYAPLQLLIVSYIDQYIKFYRINRIVQQRLEISYIQKGFKAPFLVQRMDIAVHQLTREHALVLGNECRLMQVHADPSNARFLEPIDNTTVLRLPVSEKRTMTASG